jgi:hypothetical protein
MIEQGVPSFVADTLLAYQATAVHQKAPVSPRRTGPHRPPRAHLRRVGRRPRGGLPGLRRSGTEDHAFAVVADPDKRLYAEFGVESAPRALLDPRAWGPVLWAVLRGGWGVARGREHLPASKQPGGRLGLPADFLIAGDGRVIAAKYGEHAYDQWSVDELLELATAPSRPARGAADRTAGEPTARSEQR